MLKSTGDNIKINYINRFLSTICNFKASTIQPPIKGDTSKYSKNVFIIWENHTWSYFRAKVVGSKLTTFTNEHLSASEKALELNWYGSKNTNSQIRERRENSINKLQK